MKKFFKNLIVIILILMISSIPTSAKDIIKAKANIEHSFNLSEPQKEISFTTNEDIILNENITIPKGSLISGNLYQTQRELRWHKAAFFICQVMNYTPKDSIEAIDVSDQDFYLVARKYEKVNKKEASILATEIILATAASVFAPGVDVLYFFTKGAIQGKKHPNRFKAGVYNAYENSICWIWLKGKNIELKEGDAITVKRIEDEKLEKLNKKIIKRKQNDSRVFKKRLARKNKRKVKKINRKIKKTTKKQNRINNKKIKPKNIPRPQKTKVIEELKTF